ncbi:unnamed protein product [Strongylus vulgaris]|uniref:Uncharacterized protein n=1 Tax=Strongylus vulgaris TaxID=40348 RepID=A0A3P7IRL2_STRVU|nr:unnamed protein product [Strongylus vulgaris]
MARHCGYVKGSSNNPQTSSEVQPMHSTSRRTSQFRYEINDSRFRLNCSLHSTDGPAEISAGKVQWIWTSRTSPPRLKTNIMDDANEREKRM